MLVLHSEGHLQEAQPEDPVGCTEICMITIFKFTYDIFMLTDKILLSAYNPCKK